MDVLRTDDERENAERRAQGETDPRQVEGNLNPKDYTVREIQEMELSREQLQSLLDQEEASDSPRITLVEWLNELLEGEPS